MIEGLSPYPEYRDSGVAWVGKVPAGWRVESVYRMGRVQGGKALAAKAPGEQRPYLRVANVLDGVIRTQSAHTMPFTEEEFELFRLREGDVLLNEGQSLELVGRAALYRGEPEACAFQNSLIRVQASGHVLPRFLERLFRYAQASGIFATIATQTTSIAHLGVSRLADLVLALPPLDEQHAIVRFLDHLEQRIHAYSAKRRRLIALLDEEKRAVVERAVTQGLNPGVRLKDSGIEWLGTVPEGWPVGRLARVFDERVSSGREGLPVLSVSIRNGVSPSAEIDERGKPRKRIQDIESYKLAEPGDLVYNTMRMWQGALGVSPCRGLVSPAYVVAAPRVGVFTDYFALLFRLPAFLQEANRSSRGIVSDRNRLYWDDFRQIRCVVPPLEEQRQIVASIAAASAPIVAAQAAITRELDLLRDYRARVISDVVTGKVDVRSAAASLPDLAELPTDDTSDETEDDETDRTDDETVDEET